MHDGHRERKRNEILNRGLEGLPPHEILEVILYYSIPRMDTNEIAHRLIDRFGSLANVLDASVTELCEVPGIGKNSALLLKMFPETFRAYEISRNKKTINIGQWEELEKYVISLFVGQKVEKFYCICVSAGKNVISTRMMSSGYVDRVDVPAGEIIKEALAKNVKEVIVAHNHPYSSAVFSSADCAYTLNLREALKMVGVTLVDHFVVADSKCTSFIKSCS